MKYLHLKHFLLITVPLLFLISPLPPSAESEEKKSEETNEAPVVIKADSLEMDDQQKIVIFKGNVDAKEKDFLINCQKMVLHYKDQSNKQASETGEFNIEKIIATGKVIITRPEGGLATAEKALYYRGDEKVVRPTGYLVRVKTRAGRVLHGEELQGFEDLGGSDHIRRYDHLGQRLAGSAVYDRVRRLAQETVEGLARGKGGRPE